MPITDGNSSVPVRTESNGDLAVKLVDGTLPSQALAIDASGKIVVKLDDAAGNAITSQTNGASRALDVGVNVAGVQVDPRAIRALTASDVVSAAQGAASSNAAGWFVRPGDGTNSQGYTAAGEAKVSITQPLPAGTNNLGTVDIKDSAGASITVGQKAMAASLPVTIASDQSDIGIKLHDGADNSITSQANGGQRALDVGVLVSGVQVDPRAIRALTSSDIVQANIKDATGTAFSPTNPLPVNVVSTVGGTEVNSYFASAANVAAGSSDNHDYSITAGKTMKAKKFFASCSGRMKIDVQTSPDGTTFTTVFTAFSSASNPIIDINMDTLSVTDSGTGAKIRIVRTNEDKFAMGLYSTISGTEF